MESHDIRECPVYPNLRPLALACEAQAPNALGLILCTTEAGRDLMACTGYQGESEEFALQI